MIHGLNLRNSSSVSFIAWQSPWIGDDRQLVTRNWEIEMVSRDNHGVAVAAATAPMAGAQRVLT